jgi:ACR3 family arsenite efflux pump ArsB
MSCYIVPLVEAAVVSVCRKSGVKSGFIDRHLASLELMLWGGTVMLIVDHAINGELFAWTPLEMLRVGVPMALGLTLVWLIYALLKEKKAEKALTTK